MKKFKFVLGISIVLILQSCGRDPFVNAQTSEIHSLNTNCISKNAWPEIYKEYSTDKITDSAWIEKLKEFKDQPFPSDVLYFREGPEELIGIDDGHYSVRYVYNPKISDQVLMGLSPELSDAEQKRIWKRIQSLVMKYQCEEGKKEVLEEFKKEGVE